MDRRRFLKAGASAAAIPLASGNLTAKAFGMSPLSLLAGQAQSDRILVVIRMDGGNDGLNMVLPLDQYDNLAKARANILIPPDKALKLNDATGLHPSMGGLHALYQEGKLRVIQAVGYPNHNQSHFRSTDIWFTASESNQVLDSGWLGRYLDGIFPGFPDGYPNGNFPDPPAMQIGSVLSTLLQGEDAPLGMAISNPASIYSLVPNGVDVAPATPAGHELEFIRQMASQTQKYGQSIQKATAAGVNKSTLYPATGNRLADQLKGVARLISGGLQTKVYVVSIGGFDTHASQIDGATGDTTTGKHAQLLGQLSEAVAAFQDDMKLLGLEDRVVGMTMSEFGRRILSNASFGTDHGTSAPLLVFGKPVAGGILGVNPAIPAAVTVKDNVPMQFDYRSVYATLLRDWLGVSDAEVKKVMLKDFPSLPFIGPTGIVPRTPGRAGGIGLEQNFPNPFRGATTLRYRVPAGQRVILRLYDLRGQAVRTLVDGFQAPGSYMKSLEAGSLRPGTYVYRLQVGELSLQRTLQVLR